MKYEAINPPTPNWMKRYQELKLDLSMLKANGKLPLSPSTILDVGCGGGGGLFALCELYPAAHIIGIDNHSTQQHYSEYQKPKSGYFSHRFSILTTDICNSPGNVPTADLVLASRFPIIWVPGEKISWSEENLIVANRFLSLARLVAPQGTMLISYNYAEDNYPPTLVELTKLINFRQVFNQINVTRATGYNGDDWLVLSQPKSASFTPKAILTNYALGK